MRSEIASVNFNPRPPQGGRRKHTDSRLLSRRFQSTPPARGATNGAVTVSNAAIISIHAPRKGGDQKQIHSAGVLKDFNPRPPQGGRHRKYRQQILA